ncbi:hypothetical protein LSTR_LSTR006532 [Laodelphax striatellus]|uniref:Uncharacterized protein n=1 Tax=Laodelphax striatellus TaxID=195883 RepID=A0A482WYS5_LAOST|nr:hypothetical protein LSTR_LSTR006532 [Laodelphax striatellus]
MLKFCTVLIVILFVTNFLSTPTHGILEKIFGQQQPIIEKPKTKEYAFFVVNDKYQDRKTSAQKWIIPFSGMRFVSTKMLWNRFVADYYAKMNKNIASITPVEKDDRIFRKEIYNQLIDYILLYYYDPDYSTFRSSQIVAQLTSVRDKACWFYYDQFDFLNKCLQRFFIPNKVTSDGYRQFSDFPEIAKYDPSAFDGKLLFSQYYGLLTQGIQIPNVEDSRLWFIRDEPPYYYIFNATDFNFPRALNLNQFEKAKLIYETD